MIDGPTLVDRVGGYAPTALETAHAAFRRWFGPHYDLDVLNAVLAAAAAERLQGDPLWLLVVGGSGASKTETVQSLSGSGAIVTSTIASEGALLSGSPKREKAKDATGGLLCRLGRRGVLVIKDMTSILSMNGDSRAGVLAALREVHDQKWERNIGSDGGRSLTWTGRIVVVGAVTTAWDRARDVIASMGDRFVIVRMDSTDETGRAAAGRQARENTGSEEDMRRELAGVVVDVLTQTDTRRRLVLNANEAQRLDDAANLVTLARTAVDYDYRGDVIDSHAPEMPTRFVKQLFQLMRGAVAIGLDRGLALRLVIRCARDSMPPLRLAIIDDVALWPDTTTTDIRRRLHKPRSTVDRQLQSLQMLGVLMCDETETFRYGKAVTNWHYRLADHVSPKALDPTGTATPDLSPPSNGSKKESPFDRVGTNKSGVGDSAKGDVRERL